MDQAYANIDYPSKAAPEEPVTPRVLRELSDAAAVLSEATSIFITARRNHQQSLERYMQCLDQVARHREQENV